MPNLNKCHLIGHLTRDIEMRYTATNTPVANFGLAINRHWNNQQGEKQEEVTFVDCEAWAKGAEVLNQYVGKGDPLYIEGRLKLDQWENREGEKRSKLKVVVEGFQFLGNRSDGSGSNGQSQQRSAPQTRSAPEPDPAPMTEDDIPF